MKVAVAVIKNTATAMAEAKIYILTTGMLVEGGLFVVVGGSAMVVTSMGVAVDVVSVRAGVVISRGAGVVVVTFVPAMVVVGMGINDVLVIVAVVVGAGGTALTP
jgi:hypothetical protein